MRDESKFLKPIECKVQPGFYEIPGFSKYAIARDGRLYSRLQNRIVNGFKNVRGYHCYAMNRDSDDKKCVTGRHRLLCLVFKNDGRNYSMLQVNHKDHIPGSDDLVNLEWTTPQENMQHMYADGRVPPIKTFEVWNPRTGKVITIDGITNVATHLNIIPSTVLSATTAPDWRIYPCGYQVRLQTDEPWPPLPKDEAEIARIMLHNTTEKVIMVKQLVTDTETPYPNMGEVCKVLGIARPTLSQWMHEGSQQVCMGGYLLKYAHDPTPWRTDLTCIEDMFHAHNSQGDRKIVQITHSISGISKYFWLATHAAKAVGISVTALDYRLKTEGKSMFEDLNRYGYFPFDPTTEPYVRERSKYIIQRKVEEYIQALV